MFNQIVSPDVFVKKNREINEEIIKFLKEKKFDLKSLEESQKKWKVICRKCFRDSLNIFLYQGE